MKNIKSIKKRPNNLQFQLVFYFIVFTALVVVLIWLFLIFSFQYFNRNEKMKNLITYGESLVEQFNEEDIILNTIINSDDYLMIKESGSSMYLLSYSSTGDIKYYFPFNDSQGINKELISFTEILSETEKSDGYIVSDMKILNNNFLYYSKKVVYQDTDCYLILLSPMISMQETIGTLINQLIIVSFVVLVISIFVAWSVAKRLSKPINEMCETAEKWGHGDKSVVFSGDNTEELNELAETLNNAKTEIEKTEVLQKDIMANVTHDLKTPLTMIRAYAEMIQDISGNNKEKRDKHCQVIIDEVDRLTDMVNDILNLSKIQSGVDNPQKDVFNLSELVTDVIDRFEEAFENDNYTIKHSIESDIYVIADEKKIETVLYNLIGNSLNYTGDDKTIKIYLNKVGSVARFEILDSGKGIDKESIDTIWTKYMRVSETHKRQTNGTGLGLSIVKAVLDSHNLEYGVLSKVGVGSNFYIIFNTTEKPENLSEN